MTSILSSFVVAGSSGADPTVMVMPTTTAINKTLEEQYEDQDFDLEGLLLRERMEVMFWQEATHYRTSDYLAAAALADPNLLLGDTDGEGIMNEQWRTRMCEWAYQLVDHFDFPREIVGTCMNLLDRYLTSHFANSALNGLPLISKKKFQVVTMCCLYVAVKVRGQSRVPLQYMVQLSRGTVNESELKAMEMQLLSQLSWLVNPPTAFDFVKHYLELLQPCGSSRSDEESILKKPFRIVAIEDLASFLVELSVLDYYFVNFRPSTVAVAALFNAMDEDPQLRQHTGNNPFLQHTLYHGCEAMILPGEESNVFLCRQRLGSLYQNAGGTMDVESDDLVPSRNDKEDIRITSPVSVVATTNIPDHHQQSCASYPLVADSLFQTRRG